MKSGTHYTDLVLYKIYADLKAEAATTYLNFLWWILEPVLYMAVFYVVFGLMFQRGGGPEYIPFLLVGLTVWKWFDSAIRKASISIQSNSRLISQIYLPKVLFPVISIGETTFKFFIVLVILLVFLVFFTDGFGATYLSLPALLLTQLLLIMACSMLLAALVPFLPDLSLVISNGMVLMMFLSGVFFSGNRIPEQYRETFFLNPMARLIEEYRSVLLTGSWPDWSSLAIISGVSLVVIAIAVAIMTRYNRVYPKVLG